MMLLEFSELIADGPDDPIGILVLASVFRDDAPWLYELGVDAYRAIALRRRDSNRVIRRFRRALDVLLRGPFPLEELGLDPRTIDIVLRELPRYLDRYLVEHPGPDVSVKRKETAP